MAFFQSAQRDEMQLFGIKKSTNTTEGVIIIVVVLIDDIDDMLIPFCSVDRGNQNCVSKPFHHVKILWMRTEIYVVRNGMF
jgi:hypothetical protein